MIEPGPLGKKIAALPKVAAFYALWFPSRCFGLNAFFGYGEYGPLATHLRFIARASRRLARASFYGMLRYQAGLEKRQGFLFRWVDIAMELFAMAASISNAHTRAKKGLGDEAIVLADTFCKGARLKVEELFRGLWKNTDAEKVALSQRVLRGEYRWLEDGIITLDEAESARLRRSERAQTAERVGRN